MKAICLSAAMTLVLFFAASLLLRRGPTVSRARNLTLLFLGASAVLGVIWEMTPEDLGFLPAALVAQPRWLDGAATLFFFAAAYVGGILQLYNLADRGFSLRILIDLLKSRRGAANAKEMAVAYSASRGIVWMYRKRIDGMRQGGFVRAGKGVIALTPKGRTVGAVFLALRRFLRLDIPA